MSRNIAMQHPRTSKRSLASSLYFILPRCRSGFTLVELLVVIVIVALLLSLLIPTLGMARYTAKKTLSLGNMHQIANLIHCYATDNNDFVPNTSRQDQGCNYWSNYYIVTYPTNLVTNTIGYSLVPYISSPDILMAPNHWDQLVARYKPADPGNFNYWYGYWYHQPAQQIPGFYRFTSYSYLPWAGYLSYPAGPNMRMSGSMSSGATKIQFPNMALLEEVVSSVDATAASQYKSVNFINGVSDGGNILFGDGSAKWAPRTAYLGGQTAEFQNGGYTLCTYDIIYRK